MSTSNGVVVPGPMANDVEVLAKATRRRFSAEYKLKILREAEACTTLREVLFHPQLQGIIVGIANARDHADPTENI